MEHAPGKSWEWITDTTFTASNYNSGDSCYSSLAHTIDWNTRIFKSVGNLQGFVWIFAWIMETHHVVASLL